MSILSDQDKCSVLEGLGGLAVISRVMYCCRILVAEPGVFQLCIEFGSVLLLGLLAGEVGGQIDFATEGLLMWGQF